MALLTAGQQVLLLLDNAALHTADQAHCCRTPAGRWCSSPAGGGCRSSEGAAHLALDSMDLADAMTLFSRIAGLDYDE